MSTVWASMNIDSYNNIYLSALGKFNWKSLCFSIIDFFVILDQGSLNVTYFSSIPKDDYFPVSQVTFVMQQQISNVEVVQD